MSDREKLIELVDGAMNLCISTKCSECIYIDEVTDKDPLYSRNCQNKLFADHLISNGVTIGVDAKPLKQYLAQIDEYAGLKLKFLVFKADTGERVENCFVLRPDKDPAAVEALRAYAEATDNKTLADDIYNWVGKGVTAQKWIPVSERLPTMGKYLCLCDGDTKTSYMKICSFTDNLYAIDEFDFYGYENVAGFFDYDSDYGHFRQDNVTHWMPLPPKECE